jgi:hypothetical protein
VSPMLHARGERHMKAKAVVRDRGTRTNVAIVSVSIAVILVAVALIGALTVVLPPIAWVGFGIVSMILLGLGVAATLAVPRMRVSPPMPAAAVDEERRLLVIADPYCNELALCDAILAHLEGAVAAHLVVPVRVSHLHFLADDEMDERRDAEQSSLISVGLLQTRGIPATSSTGPTSHSSQ